MSSSALSWAIHQAIRPATAKTLLNILADHEGEGGRIFPCVDRLCAFTGFDRKTVFSAKKRLMDLGILECTDERVGHRGQTVVYRINRDWGGAYYDRNCRLVLGRDGNKGDGKDVQQASRIRDSFDDPKSSENGTPSSTENGTLDAAKESRFRYAESSKGFNQLEEDSPLPPEGGKDLFGQDIAPVAITDQQIADRYIAAWGKLVEEAPKLQPVGRFSEQRRTELLARLKDHGIPRDLDAIDMFLASILERVNGSRFLRGDDKPSFRASWGWVLKRANFDKIEEGFYAQNYRADGAGQPRSDRPAERSMLAAGQDALDILRARRGTA